MKEPRNLFKELFDLKNTPEGRELQWRQRLSTETVYNLASKRDYVNALQYFLVAAWNDRVVLNAAESIKNAMSIDIHLPNDGVISLNLKKFQNFITISDLPEAFKDFWINMSTEDSSNWDQLLSMMPNGAQDGDIIDNLPRSNVFSDIVGTVAQEEIKALNSLINESTKNSSIAPGVISKVKLKLEFWTELLPEALNKTIGAGTYNKLNQLADEIQKGRVPSG